MMRNPAAAEKPVSAKARSGKKTLAHGTMAAAPSVPGRRDWFKYRELGVSAASCGVMQAQTIFTSRGLSEPTGWHYHVCERQFIYALKGWVDLEFEDGTKLRLNQTGSRSDDGVVEDAYSQLTRFVT